jgi:uncharacterized protein YjbI with pentapeptide repeats
MINQITREDLAKHAAWLRDKPDGVRVVTVSHANLNHANLSHADLRDADLRSANLRDADLSHANLSYANLSGANLRYANLRDANLSSANLRDANLSSANLSSANLRGANLRDANLSHADLSYANLSGANLRDANLSDADLSGADLSSANLRDADLSGANLSDADLSGAENIPEYVTAITSIVPDGDLVVYKQLAKDSIATLKIPASARRSNATGRKCRAEYAEVLAIESSSGESLAEGQSRYNSEFVYRVGETVHPHEWCEDRWQECAGGIHFYLTRYEAVNN